MCLWGQGQGDGRRESIWHKLGLLPFCLQEKSTTEHWGKRMPMGETTRHGLGAGCNPRIRVCEVQPFSWCSKPCT